MHDISFNSQHVSNDEQRNLDANIEGHPIDILVGSRVRSLRISAGISEEEMRAALAVTAEQMRAYESGAMRIGASLLYDISKLLACVPTVFFENRQIF
jgi:hypothetical protein